MGGVRETLGEYSKTRQVAFGASMIIGAAFFCTGVIGDWRGWWNGLGFVPNAITSLAGFFFGVPIALVLLSTLTDEREERSQLNKLRGLSDAAWQDFSDRVHEFCTQGRIDALRLAGGDLANRWQSMSALLQSCWEFDPIPQFKLGLELAPVATEIEALVVSFRRSFDDRAKDLQIKWVGLQRSWAVLDSYVKIQRFERRQSWLSPDIDSSIQDWLRGDAHPMTEFLSQHLSTGALSGVSLQMEQVPELLRSLESQTFEERISFINTSNSPIYKLVASSYSAQAFAAAEVLRRLRDSVEAAEKGQGWPHRRGEVGQKN
ncbi:hypothetical protein [Mycobacterium sp. AT1]|uniref:hypothetical protein n=1 Tax=Mycobacterium sp. AT1 TaxID=1961706 RepID=UPI0009AE00F8|nr:hypothetical protein [Mycobacterium sp. AT1]OPX05533.1 hypothetical protein B1790_31625 [Mycobacterium sp. AT1]